jgi:hypothetical protein
VTKSVVFGFSFCCGSRFAIARFARAFLGLLELTLASYIHADIFITLHVHLFQHVVVAVVCRQRRTLGRNFFLRIDNGPAKWFSRSDKPRRRLPCWRGALAGLVPHIGGAKAQSTSELDHYLSDYNCKVAFPRFLDDILPSPRSISHNSPI